MAPALVVREAEEEAVAVGVEYAGARLGDARLGKRLDLMARRLAPAPDRSFPQAMQGEAELEGAYRFLSNRQVRWRELLAPHVAQTCARMQEAAREGVLLVAAHDTTELHFQGEVGARRGLGQLARGHQGFHAHVALGAALLPPAQPEAGARHRPLGALGLVPQVRRARPQRTLKQRKAQSSARSPTARESERWWQLVAQVEAALAAQDAATPALVHVMDREADNYRLLAQLLQAGHRFVIRARFDRLQDSGRPMSEALEQSPRVLGRTVRLGAREERWTNGKRVPARKSRPARLEVRACPLTLKASDYALKDADVPARLTLHAVEVFEPQPPEGEEPVRWVLLTCLPIDTGEQLSLILDAYCARWCVEELFKALKTGCSLEKRQLGSLRALLNALCLFIPIAWRLLSLRQAARDTPQAPAAGVLHEDELLMLRHLAHARRYPLAATPTCEDVLYAVAALGGHLKRNGPPGWQTLARGHEALTAALVGFRAATCDQS
ncbi:IS4 family transposase [Aggregicoccus sp. 17bor-14]|uniref:IS4 family transposase n=1 Tax=Myxococcaceae TaxID=31 RepID=UPI00129D0DB7|nr:MULTISPECIES: IS4 family transposase [Myxococcaceae]MBF5046659.1 IS4 family transposase [Simulacricoccus sp. 17bor-14]MRI92368.1 IS4 family transposase [Aggregicoccus sp. 17bor-14]